jgi:Domain of unknown function (DUF3291)
VAAASTDRTAKPMPKPAAPQLSDFPARSCGAVTSGARVCGQPVDLVDFPSWCTLSAGDAHVGAAEETGIPLMVVNLSVWQSYEQLHAYVYRTPHAQNVRRRHEWFDKVPTPATVLWWVPAGHQPTLA